MCPSGKKSSSPNHIALYLSCNGSSSFAVDYWSVLCNFALGICNYKSDNVTLFKIIGDDSKGFFSLNKSSWGWKNFVSYDSLSQKVFKNLAVLEDDRLNVFCVLRIHSEVPSTSRNILNSASQIETHKFSELENSPGNCDRKPQINYCKRKEESGYVIGNKKANLKRNRNQKKV